MKTQQVRLLDVFVLGPFMVWYANQTPQMNPLARSALTLAGIATIVYNGLNYLDKN